MNDAADAKRGSAYELAMAWRQIALDERRRAEAKVARRGIDAGAACCRCPKTTDDEPSEWTFAEDIGWLCRECAARQEEDR